MDGKNQIKNHPEEAADADRQTHRRSLAVVAIASRPAGATRWDAAGILAALRKVHHLEAGEVAATVVDAACDPSLDTPAAIGNTSAPLLEARPHHLEQLDAAPATSRPSLFPCGNWTHAASATAAQPHAQPPPHPRPADSPDLQAKIAAIRAQVTATTKPENPI